MIWKVLVCRPPTFSKFKVMNCPLISLNSFHSDALVFYPRGNFTKAASPDLQVLDEFPNQDKANSLTDKLYEKYGYLFAESPSDDKEIIYKTSFGFVRLDSENSIDSKPKLKKIKRDVSLDSNGLESNLSLHERKIFKGSPLSEKDGMSPDSEKDGMFSDSEKVGYLNPVAGILSPSEENNPNNYIDEFYFPSIKTDSIDKNQTNDVCIQSNTCTMSLNNRIEENDSSGGSDTSVNFRHNCIDEMYFGTSMCNGGNSSSRVVEASQFNKQSHNEILQSDLQDISGKQSTRTEFQSSLELPKEESENDQSQPQCDGNFVDEAFFPNLFKNNSESGDTIKQPIQSGMKATNKILDKAVCENLVHSKTKDPSITKPKRSPSMQTKVPNLKLNTRHEILSILKNSVIYNKDGIIVIDKPYGLKCQPDGASNDKLDLKSYLPKLSTHLNVPQLEIIHRLDKVTTGVMLLGANDEVTNRLKAAFKENRVVKLYWLLAVGPLEPKSGTINIPIAEGIIGNKYRMVLHPVDNARFSHKKSRAAVSHYKVLSEMGRASLVEVRPVTGVKHQIRVHLGFGLGCPILGDHKYSHLNKLAPQRLPESILHKLSLSQAQVRTLPIYLHAKQIIIPQFLDGSDLHVSTALPNYFYKMTKKLGLDLKAIKSKDHLSLETTDINTALHV